MNIFNFSGFCHISLHSGYVYIPPSKNENFFFRNYIQVPVMETINGLLGLWFPLLRLPHGPSRLLEFSYHVHMKEEERTKRAVLELLTNCWCWHLVDCPSLRRRLGNVVLVGHMVHNKGVCVCVCVLGRPYAFIVIDLIAVIWY